MEDEDDADDDRDGDEQEDEDGADEYDEEKGEVGLPKRLSQSDSVRAAPRRATGGTARSLWADLSQRLGLETLFGVCLSGACGERLAARPRILFAQPISIIRRPPSRGASG